MKIETRDPAFTCAPCWHHKTIERIREAEEKKHSEKPAREIAGPNANPPGQEPFNMPSHNGVGRKNDGCGKGNIGGRKERSGLRDVKSVERRNGRSQENSE